MFKKHLPLIKEMARDRDILTAWIVFVVSALVVVVTAAVHIAPSELQVTVHYTGYGVTNFYRDSWYYLAVFALQAALLLVAHTLIALKLHEAKGKAFTVFFLYLSVGLALITELLLLGLFRVVALVQ